MPRRIVHHSRPWIPFGQRLVKIINEGPNIEDRVILRFVTGHVIYAASPELVDVIAAYVLASPGDAIRIPAGTGNVTWTGQLIDRKGLVWIGPGAENLTITGAFVASVSNSYIEGYQIGYKPTSPGANPPFRWTGFTVNFGTGSAGFGIFDDDPLSPITKIRIDHNNLSKAGNGQDMIISQGHVYGCVDNNILTGGYFMLRAMGNDAASWTNQEFAFGTANNLYYEDNIILCTVGYADSIMEGGAGGRYAFRYNDITFGVSGLYQAFDLHGNTAASHSSTMGAEIYENTIRCPNSPSGGWLVAHRGGRLVAFNNNTIQTPGYQVIVLYEEARDSDNPPAFSPDGQPQHQANSYYFNNTVNGTLIPTSNYAITSTIDYNSSPAEDPYRVVPQWNLDGWRHTTPFTGASGVGVGLLSARPSSGLVAGVGYWATDLNILYRATSPTTWEIYYAPYAYPHPHRSDPVLGD